MREVLDRYLAHLSAAGLAFDLAPDLARDPDHAGDLIRPGPRPRRIEGLAPRAILEHDDQTLGLGSDHATMSVARVLAGLGPSLAGQRVLELGCGTGLLAIQAALFGARVLGTDVDDRVLDLARRNAVANEVTIDWRLGFLCEPLRADERFDLVIANLPHKPARDASLLPLSQHGGPEGDELFARAERELRPRLGAGARWLFFLHSLPNPRLLLRLAERHDLVLRSWKLRHLGRGEYGALLDSFRRRHQEGLSFLHRDGDHEALVACVWEARRRADDS
ncbi:MAG: methyltransferase domain-containing protein [Planctomycetes bacterium]|nr:methyltransferase domain-containing protein [Planctomycetota bacterium]